MEAYGASPARVPMINELGIGLKNLGGPTPEPGTDGERGEPVETPPVLCLQGERDVVHPRAHLERFVAAYGRAGGEAALRWFPDEAEGFVNKKPDSPSTAKAIDEIVRFVRANGGNAALA